MIHKQMQLLQQQLVVVLLLCGISAVSCDTTYEAYTTVASQAYTTVASQAYTTVASQAYTTVAIQDDHIFVPYNNLPINVAIICGCLLVLSVAILFVGVALMIRYVKIEEPYIPHRQILLTGGLGRQGGHDNDGYYQALNPQSTQQLVNSPSAQSIIPSSSDQQLNNVYEKVTYENAAYIHDSVVVSAPPVYGNVYTGDRYVGENMQSAGGRVSFSMNGEDRTSLEMSRL